MNDQSCHLGLSSIVWLVQSRMDMCQTNCIDRTVDKQIISINRNTVEVGLHPCAQILVTVRLKLSVIEMHGIDRLYNTPLIALLLNQPYRHSNKNPSYIFEVALKSFINILSHDRCPLKIYCYLLLKYYKGWSGIKHIDRQFKNDK
jgi:hypothetical protein